MQMKKICKAFGNEQRLRLLQCLSRPHNVSELLQRCTMTQSALSQHLRVLRDAGVVKSERRGKEIVYQVRTSAIAEITNLLLTITKTL